ncbi:MAG: HxsD-like protein [Candidatus Aenigmatarchaeota archaeon]
MKNVNLKDDEAELVLKKKFYRKRPVIETVNAFSENFEVHTEECGNKFVIRIKNQNDVEIEDVAYQFLNFVLSKTKDSYQNI